MGDGESQRGAHALTDGRLIRLREGFEKAPDHLGGDAPAVVGNGELEIF